MSFIYPEHEPFMNNTAERPEPEKLLLVAVFKRAIMDYYGSDPYEADDAGRWLFDEATPGGLPAEFSFSWVCEQLGLDPGWLAEELRRESDTLKKLLSAS